MKSNLAYRAVPGTVWGMVGFGARRVVVSMVVVVVLAAVNLRVKAGVGLMIPVAVVVMTAD